MSSKLIPAHKVKPGMYLPDYGVVAENRKRPRPGPTPMRRIVLCRCMLHPRMGRLAYAHFGHFDLIRALPRYPARLMSFAKTWPQFKDGTKTVTRRSRWIDPTWRQNAAGRVVVDVPAHWRAGWPSLKVGDYVEGVEWGRCGKRFVCETCRWHGPQKAGPRDGDLERAHDAHVERHGLEPHHMLHRLRGPERLGFPDGYRRIVSLREERLGDITAEDVDLEGFPGEAAAWFVAMYCGGKPDPGRPVQRIAFERLGP